MVAAEYVENAFLACAVSVTGGGILTDNVQLNGEMVYL